jgi:hypothetical protein
MSSYSERDTYSQAGDWLMGAVRRNPEALLLLAASCCLLMRSRSSGSRSSQQQDDWDYQSGVSRASSNVRRASASTREGLSRAAESATDAAEGVSDYASQMKKRVAETASSYADSVAEFADDARRNVSERSARLKRQAQSTMESTMNRVLREQPLAVAAAGLAAGVAGAAMFPSTDIEDRALGGAHEKLRDAAEKAGARVMDAAGKAGERLKSAAEERGLTTEGLKDVAGEVADTFKDAMSGKPEDRSSASPGSSAAARGSSHNIGSQNLGMDQSKPGGGQTSNAAGTPPGGRSMR